MHVHTAVGGYAQDLGGKKFAICRDYDDFRAERCNFPLYLGVSQRIRLEHPYAVFQGEALYRARLKGTASTAGLVGLSESTHNLGV